ncbi:MAG: homoserine O-succinyltransferase MetX [Parvularcula sp.]
MFRAVENPRHVKTNAPVATGMLVQDIRVPLPNEWRGELETQIPDQFIRIRLSGTPGMPVTVVLGGISADRCVTQIAFSASENRGGWWQDIVGDGRAIDLRKIQIVSMDFAPLTPTVPIALTPRDHARLLALALEHLGISRVARFVGASFGGMVGLSFARLFPHLVDQLAVICAAHRPSPMSVAWRQVQQQIVELTRGREDEQQGIAIARQLAMTTYRTQTEFAERFSSLHTHEDSVTGYLVSRGNRFAKKMSASRFLTLSGAIDRHREDPSQIHTPTLVIGFDSDQLVPLSDVRELARTLGGRSELEVIPSRYGHDGFLKEVDALTPILSRFIDAGIACCEN